MGYGSAIVTFNTLLRTAGTYTIGIDDSPTTITVLEPAKFIIQSFQVTPSGCGAFNHKSHSHDKKMWVTLQEITWPDYMSKDLPWQIKSLT